MKKIIIIIITIVIIAICGFTAWYLEMTNLKKEITNFNSEYELYTQIQISGVDLTTIINKAIDNNEQYSISKDENGLYIDDGGYYIEIYINVTETEEETEENNEESDEQQSYAYPMEAFDEVGMTTFTSLYGASYFECVNTEYHENGRISKLIFEIIN